MSIKSINKQIKMKEITALLRVNGPLSAAEIINSIQNVKPTTTNRYILELSASGHIKKTSGKGGRLNVPLYQHQSDYGAKTDIVSLAISHPLHQLTLSMVQKNVLQDSEDKAKSTEARLY